MTNATTRTAWTRRPADGGGVEYIHACGGRVYSYLPQAWKGREWGVQKSSDKQGCGGFASMAEAKAYIERYDPALSA